MKIHPTDRRCLHRLLNAALVLLLASGRLRAQAPPSHLEDQVKVAFLYNFAKFVDWPDAAFSGASRSFMICVLSDGAFADTLEQAVKDKAINGHGLVVRRLNGLEEAVACHMLYLDSQASSKLTSIPASMRGAAVLTVGETQEFLRQGGIIGFVLQDNRVHFQINPDAATRAGLKISSKLLQLAIIVRTTAQAEGR